METGQTGADFSGSMTFEEAADRMDVPVTAYRALVEAVLNTGKPVQLILS